MIDSKNKYLPGFIAASTKEQRVELLSEVEKRLVRAQLRVAQRNATAEDALRNGKDAGEFRRQVGNIQAYLSVLKGIQKILTQS